MLHTISRNKITQVRTAAAQVLLLETSTLNRFGQPSVIQLNYLRFALNLYITPTEIAKFTSVCVIIVP